jgi:hypothetical protein
MTEYCEWDPARNDAAYEGEGCRNEAELCVGAKGEWHLCRKCAALPRFKRLRARKPLRKKGVQA